MLSSSPFSTTLDFHVMRAIYVLLLPTLISQFHRDTDNILFLKMKFLLLVSFIVPTQSTLFILFYALCSADNLHYPGIRS